MFCMDCGKKIPDVARFCVFCGTPVDSSVLMEASGDTVGEMIPRRVEMEESDKSETENSVVMAEDAMVVTEIEEATGGIEQEHEEPEPAEAEEMAEQVPTETESGTLNDAEGALDTAEDIRAFCTNCGAILEPDDSFCTNCGHKREVPIIPIVPAQESSGMEERNTFCIRCGNKLYPEDMFCNLCGEPVGTVPYIRKAQATDVRNTGESESVTEQAIVAVSSHKEESTVLERTQQSETTKGTETKTEVKDEPMAEEAPSEVPAETPSEAPVSISFFDRNDYIIDEKVSAFKFTNGYRIFDTGGTQIGTVEQQKLSGGATAARLLLGSSVKSMQSFHLDIQDASGKRIAAIERGGIGGGFQNLRQVDILDGNGSKIGMVRMIPHFTRSEQEILDAFGNLAARIDGDWKGWNFQIASPEGRNIGTVSKSWNGVAKELFTTADKYRVSLSSDLTIEQKTLIGAAAITIDMILHELA